MYHKRKNNKDLKYILSNLREQDEHELKIMYGKDWFKLAWAIFRNLKGCRIAYKDNGCPVAVFGVVPRNDVGIIVMLSTSDIEKEQRSFLVQGKIWVASCEKKYNLLKNQVYSSNTKAIKWLKWLGFTVEENKGMGDKFLEFYKISQGQRVI